MKRILSILCGVLMGICSMSACVKKAAAASPANPVMIIVMDTTQALLDGAQVTIGKSVFKTSFDGRVVLKPEQIGDAKSCVVSCEGYKEETIALHDVRTLVVRLTPKAGKKPKKEDIYYSYGTTRTTRSGKKGDVMYKTAMVAAAPMEDGAVFEEEVAFLAVEEAPTVSNTISAGKLTAGEVNDFTKWSFWPNVLDGSHKEFISTWQIDPRQRYTVQVVNKEGYPVVNYPVSLKYGNNTLFQAVTDNTGKAELWGNLITSNPKTMVEVPEQTIVVDEPCEAPEDVDVLFVFDATGSMGDELHYLQAEMKDVISRASAATGGLNIRTGAVVYRDHGDEYITRISRLTDNIKTTQAFIDKQHANGGGDFPEAIPEALMAALNSAGWNENVRARIAFLVLDAPCHQDSATIALLHEQVLNAAAMGVRIVPVVCSGLDKAGELLMRSIALATNGTSFFLTDDSGIGHSHLKPTTDSLKVEHLNDMLVRTIVEFSAMPSCEPEQEQEVAIEEQFIPNPFDAMQLEDDPTIPHGEGVHYLLDVSGKLITILEGTFDETSLKGKLPIGIYFVKTFYDGQWHTRKILLR